jgi:glycosyltransferase involved in cell wall biosynthesis
MGRRIGELDGVVAPSRFFAGVMERRLGLPGGQIEVIPNGMALEGYAPASVPPAGPVIGYLARFIRGKGLGTLVDAFIELHRRGRVPGVRLRCAGTMIAEDAPYLEQQKERLRDAGLLERAEFLPNVSREEKITFLQSLSLLSVPASYGEAFGLYLLEAMACGVPVVQPRVAAFPEIVEATGGGVLVDENDSAALATGMEALLLDAQKRSGLGSAALKAVHGDYSMQQMAARFLRLSERVQTSQKES